MTNAGGPIAGGFADIAYEDYEPRLHLNLLSTVAMCQAAVSDMRAAGWGRVVAITSVSVRQPIPSLILSNTARAGATGFLKTLALEVAPDGVTVNSIQPGTHDTDRIRQLHGADTSGAAAAIPVGRLGDADDFGAAARSCAASRPSSSPASRSTSTAAPTAACSSAGPDTARRQPTMIGTSA